MLDLIERARDYAISAHNRINQRRKFSHQAFDVHLKGVADLVASVTKDEEIIAAAWLHDAAEDTSATFEEIERLFGRRVSRLVMELTDVSTVDDGNTPSKSESDMDHTAFSSPGAKTIKLADLIDTCNDFSKGNPQNTARFLQQMVDLLTVLHEGNDSLYRRALRTLDKVSARIKVPVPEPTWKKNAYRSNDDLFIKNQGGDSLKVFTDTFCARDILEPLHSYELKSIRVTGTQDLSSGNIPVIGLRERGVITGYMLAEDLTSSRQSFRKIENIQKVQLDTPLATIINILTMFTCCFVMINDEAIGVITRMDIEKPVVRMWLFGLIILIETKIVNHIKETVTNDDWQQLLTPGRLEKARELQRMRAERGAKAELLDCLQFSDKLLIGFSSAEIGSSMDFPSNKAARRVMQDMESLRNNLAHGQDITDRDWPQIARLARRIKEMF